MLLFIFLRLGAERQQKIALKVNTTLRIAIDRPPNGLFPGQTLDVTGRRFLPLLKEYEIQPQTKNDVFGFKPKNPNAGRPNLEFTVVRDETTSALKFLKGETDILYDILSISKTEWIRKNHPEYRIFVHSGLNLSYIGFSNRHPILKDVDVRRAIAMALPVRDWVKYKLFDWADLSTEFVQINYDPEAAAKIFDREGYPVQADGVRLRLNYFTTGVREGNDTALMVQEALKKISIEVQVVTLDTLLYFQKMKKGEGDLFSTRWFRFDEKEPIAPYLSTDGTRNYLGYSNPKLDQKLKKNPSLTQRELADLLKKDFPFFPLYTWKHAVILQPRVWVENETRLSANLDETFRFLLELKLK